MEKKYAIVEHIWKSHKNYLGTGDHSLKGFDIMHFMANLFCPGPFYYYIIDSPTLNFELVSPNTETLLGIKPQGFSLEKLFDIVHPDDIVFLMKCEDIVAYFLKNCIPREKMTKYKISYCLREKTKHHGYRLFLLQTITLKTTKEGALLKVFGSHTDITHITNVNNHKLSLIGLDGEPSFLEIDVFQDKVLDNYKPFDLMRAGEFIPFTPREMDIIRFLASGSTNEAIADNLNISVRTVETHRKNILRKSETKNTTEMIVDCLKNGYI